MLFVISYSCSSRAPVTLILIVAKYFDISKCTDRQTDIQTDRVNIAVVLLRFFKIQFLLHSVYYNEQTLNRLFGRRLYYRLRNLPDVIFYLPVQDFCRKIIISKMNIFLYRYVIKAKGHRTCYRCHSQGQGLID